MLRYEKTEDENLLLFSMIYQSMIILFRINTPIQLQDAIFLNEITYFLE